MARAALTLVALAIVALASIALLSALAARRSLAAERSRVAQVESANRALKSKLDSLARQTASADAAAGQLSLRIGSIEAKGSAQPDPAALAKRAAPSVFTVEVDAGLGSGFVMRAAGGGVDLVTDYHVVEGNWLAHRLEVTIKQGDLTYSATIVKVNAADDLALLHASVTLPALSAATTPVAIGDAVLVIGSPLGLGGSVATGIVSALRVENGVHYIQFSAPISPGNSGGPVLDAAGKVIGVSVSKYVATGAEGLSFATPVAAVCSDLEVC
jgi:S1-C subfamily serine protease